MHTDPSDARDNHTRATTASSAAGWEGRSPVEAGGTRPTLFGAVPADAFRALSGRSRQFYADLLAFLADEVFAHAGDAVSRKRALASVAEFVARQGRGVVEASLAEERRTSANASQIAYDRLVETGWLVEYPDRYHRVVDFDPAARLLLQALLDIRSGRLRSYGGAVLQAVTLLESVVEEPQPRRMLERALNVREAAAAARSFLSHLKTVGAAMRQVEARVTSQPSADALVRSFVEDFVQAGVVRDYRNLHTRDSPYRFRDRVLELAERLMGDPEAVARIAEGCRRAGLADATEHDVVEDLRSTARTFAAVDQHLRAIEETTYRIERRMRNVVRLSGRISPVDVEEVRRTLGLLGRSGLDGAETLGVAPPIAAVGPPLDHRHLYTPARRRPGTGETPVPVRERDPALDRYLAALDAFEARLDVTPRRLEAFLERALLAGGELRSSDLVIDGVDDFIMLERIHEVATGPLAERYEFAEAPGRLSNEWIDRTAFTIRRKADG